MNADFWLKLDDEFLTLANSLIVLLAPGWDTSYGVSKEIESMQAQDKLIYSLNWDDSDFSVVP